jgi:hypothetical protein
MIIPKALRAFRRRAFQNNNAKAGRAALRYFAQI